MWRWVLGAALVGMMPGAATADVYSYTQDNGTLAFTDDAERVPERYRETVEKRPDRPLDDYPRLTVSASWPESSKVRRTLLESLLAEDVASGAPLPFSHMRSTAPPAYLQVAPGVSLPVDAADSGEPIRVERRFRWIEGRYSPVLIVRRGDRVLLETEELAPQY